MDKQKSIENAIDRLNGKFPDGGDYLYLLRSGDYVSGNDFGQSFPHICTRVEFNVTKGRPEKNEAVDIPAFSLSADDTEPAPAKPWFEAGKFPPVGVRCEAAIPHDSGADNERSFIWVEGSVIAYCAIKGATYAWFAEDDGFYPPSVLEFRPIKTDKEKAIDAADAVIRKTLSAADDAALNALYDAGLLRLPGEK